MLGEGCIWDPRDSRLCWTDIETSRIYRLALANQVTSFTLPERAAFILPRLEPGFVVDFASRIVLGDVDLRMFTTVAVVEPDLPQTRVNDAVVDSQGGSFSARLKRGTASRLPTSTGCHPMER